MKFKVNDHMDEPPFEREDLIKKIVKLTQLSSDSGTILALKGTWGTGKTHIAKEIERKINETNTNVIYFDAWKYDFLDDPFYAILSKINKLKPSESLLKKAIPIAKAFAKVGFVETVRIVTAGNVDLDKVKNDIQTELSCQDEVKNEINKFESFESNLETFKDEINKVGSTLYIIDELDRCKPSFAIKLLERIKHLFSTQNFCFMIIFNEEALLKSLEHEYGYNEKELASSYLQRFFDFSITVPKVKSLSNTHNHNAHSTFCRKLVLQHELDKEFPIGFVQNIVYILAHFGETWNLTFRDIQRILEHLVVYLIFYKEDFTTQKFHASKDIIIGLVIYYIILNIYPHFDLAPFRNFIAKSNKGFFPDRQVQPFDTQILYGHEIVLQDIHKLISSKNSQNMPSMSDINKSREIVKAYTKDNTFSTEFLLLDIQNKVNLTFEITEI